ncbi:RNA polymerase sigma factor [Sphingobacterium faecale]|uniref:Sigma-70 family RNA polymerase sigma factor n=1 Tax=Sphingobacterium faecale TaxID=2803775 RepID=A0ABS1RAD5_9SPHI|nr:sigma-70 family RNA polymerase sigma factor [Sphingobacterium faecale]MBL1410992.1 sigma-70 family RNA polymerase sigma factor [Sphingobacterium faecale]
MATNQRPDEDVLIPGLWDGDDRVFQQIIKDFLQPLRYYAWTFVKIKEVAEEIAYDAFVKLWQERSRFQSDLQVKRFLYVVTKNKCLDHLKSADTRFRQVLDDTVEIPIADIDLEAKVIQTELMQAIYTEINNLPHKQATVFRLSYLEGMSVEEISIQLGISINAVYLNKSLAGKTLQRIFKDKGDWLYVLFLLQFGDF